MTRITHTKLVQKVNLFLKNDQQFQADIARKEYQCPVCGGPMFLSPGQIQAAHGGACSKKFKRWQIKNRKRNNQ